MESLLGTVGVYIYIIILLKYYVGKYVLLEKSSKAFNDLSSVISRLAAG